MHFHGYVEAMNALRRLLAIDATDHYARDILFSLEQFWENELRRISASMTIVVVSNNLY